MKKVEIWTQYKKDSGRHFEAFHEAFRDFSGRATPLFVVILFLLQGGDRKRGQRQHRDHRPGGRGVENVRSGTAQEASKEKTAGRTHRGECEAAERRGKRKGEGKNKSWERGRAVMGRKDRSAGRSDDTARRCNFLFLLAPCTQGTKLHRQEPAAETDWRSGTRQREREEGRRE